VQFLGYVGDDDLAALFQSALCLVFPSITEGFGVPLVEAMSLGCPVIASNVASMPEVCGDAALYADPFDPKTWLAQIRRMANDAELRGRLIADGHVQVRKFSWARSARIYLDLMRNDEVSNTQEISRTDDSAGAARPIGAKIEPGKARGPAAKPDRLTVMVGVATIGRKEILRETIDEIARQTRRPDSLVICPTNLEDVDVAHAEAQAFPVKVSLAPAGLTRQRNALLAEAAGADILLFIDDDFFLAPDFVERMERLFLEDDSLVMITGEVVVDGIKGPGLSPHFARNQLSTLVPARGNSSEVYNGYGCNMAFRMREITALNMRFDERLPLYGWLEDVDFSRRAARFGRLIRHDSLRGVHLGAKAGRQSGVKLGYSQIANPLYFIRKRTMTPRRALAQIGRNVLKNLVMARRPEAWIDRRGRLRGNYLAVLDLCRGKLAPERILDID